MPSSQRLRLEDVRRVFRLLGECRDLGNSATLWKRHAMEGLCGLMGAKSGVALEFPWQRPRPPRALVQVVAVGFDPTQWAFILEWFRTAWPNDPGIFLTGMQHLTGEVVTRARTQVVDDRSWYRSPEYEARKEVQCDHNIYSLCQTTDDGMTSFIGLDRASGDRDFSPRERELLNLFLEELRTLIGPVLAPASQPDPMQLSPRLRQTLKCLLDGDSEKQAAWRIGLSPMTIHEYVTTLYRHFQVHSRAELLASFLKRVGHTRLWEDEGDVLVFPKK